MQILKSRVIQSHHVDEVPIVFFLEKKTGALPFINRGAREYNLGLTRTNNGNKPERKKRAR
jgi:hypothetical protein